MVNLLDFQEISCAQVFSKRIQEAKIISSKETENFLLFLYESVKFGTAKLSDLRSESLVRFEQSEKKSFLILCRSRSGPCLIRVCFEKVCVSFLQNSRKC